MKKKQENSHEKNGPIWGSFYAKILSIILISSLGIIVYLNALSTSFHLDDAFSIVDNFTIRNIHDLQSIWGFWPSRFIVYFSFALNYHFNQFNVFGYHLFNLGIHLLVAISVWWLVLLTFSTPALKEEEISRHANPIALLAGLIFVSHPVQTEAVTYVVQRAASMATLFYLASLCLFIKARLLQDRKIRSLFGGYCYLGSFIAAISAMFCKEMAVTLPLMILFYEFSFLRTKGALKWKYILPFFLTLIIIPLASKYTSAARFQILRVDPGISSWDYLLTQFRVMVTYLRLTIMPLNLNLDYDYPVYKSVLQFPVLASFLSLTAILVLAQRLFLKYRIVAFFIFWFFLTLLPESSFFPIKDVIFEHRLYLPLVGFSIFLVSALYYLLGKKNPVIIFVILGLVIGFNGFLTYQRNKVWKDEFTLWNDTVQKSPHKSRPHNNRGYAYYSAGKFVEAMDDYNKSIELDPKYDVAYNNRGGLYFNEGKLDQALADYNKAIEITSDFAKPYYNRGLVYALKGEFDQAIADYSESISIDIDFTEAYAKRAAAYAQEGKYDQALADCQKAIDLKPDYSEPYYDQGLIYYKQGDLNQAILNYTKAIAMTPDYVEAYNDLGNVYEKKGDFPQALENYNKAVELKPGFSEGYVNRGIVYYNQGDFADAISSYDEAIKLKPKYAENYFNRGLIYVRQGKRTQALDDYSRAITFNPKYLEAYMNRGNLYFGLGDLNQAIANFTKSIEIDPVNAKAYCNRGYIYSNEGKLNQAMVDLTKAIELNPHLAEAFTNRGVVYAKNNDLVKAMSDLNKSIELNPESAEAYTNRGIINGNQGNLKQALSDYSKAIALNPGLGVIYINRAFIYHQLNENDKVREDIHQAQRLGIPLSPDASRILKEAQ